MYTHIFISWMLKSMKIAYNMITSGKTGEQLMNFWLGVSSLTYLNLTYLGKTTLTYLNFTTIEKLTLEIKYA